MTTQKITTQILVHGRIPSKKNQLRRIKRAGRIYTVPSKNHELWERKQLKLVSDQKELQRIDQFEKVRVVVIFIYFPDNLGSDLTNKAESIMDLLVKAGILKNDKWQVIPRLELVSMGVDRTNPRAEIFITV